MKTLVVAIVAGASVLCGTAAGRAEKPLPPAFGKELVPSQESQERNEPKDGELEDEQERHGSVRHSTVPHSGHGKIHVELDGDEDGGDSGGDDEGL
jgi:hypothetical protein